ncbi:MAG: hypothetical protein OEM21_02740 [Nitrosopumilus sp.]|nr:hypothetical protein [Nitrosopumilus sp.]
MDKLILIVGAMLVGLGIGFLIAGSIDYTLSSAYTAGGYLWLVVGAVTIGIGIKVRQSNQQELAALR